MGLHVERPGGRVLKGRPPRPVAELAHRQSPRARPAADTGWPSYHDMLGRVAVLERAPLFFSLPESPLKNLARRIRQLAGSPRGIVIYQGEPGDSIFFIESGRCNWIIERPPGSATVAVHRPGDR